VLAEPGIRARISDEDAPAGEQAIDGCGANLIQRHGCTQQVRAHGCRHDQLALGPRLQKHAHGGTGQVPRPLADGRARILVDLDAVPHMRDRGKLLGNRGDLAGGAHDFRSLRLERLDQASHSDPDQRSDQHHDDAPANLYVGVALAADEQPRSEKGSTRRGERETSKAFRPPYVAIQHTGMRTMGPTRDLHEANGWIVPTDPDP
jgi:hypothetical protein